MEKPAHAQRLRLCAPCLFGLEGPLGNELRHMGMGSVAPENGRVLFETDEYGLARANIRSRFAERILLELGSFRARSFEELFEGVRALPFEDWLPREAAFPVKGWALESQLHSVPDCQSIIKKAAALRMGSAYGLERLPETGELYQIQFSIMKDEAHIYLDTTGTGLHKRGYRVKNGLAPIKETLAAAIIMLSGWTADRPFTDPFAGSGTFPVEAALMAMNIAPGLNRSFAFEQWVNCPDRAKALKAEAASMIATPDKLRISGFDIDAKSVKLAAEHAALAGVGDKIHFQKADMRTLSSRYKGGYIVTNPPYGERLLSYEETLELYRDFGKVFRSLNDWNLSIITAFKNFEKAFGRKADKNRKLYNSQLECRLYIYKSRGLNN